jgi:hypothetical protein
MSGVARWDKIKNEHIRGTVRVTENLIAERAELKAKLD